MPLPVCRAWVSPGAYIRYSRRCEKAGKTKLPEGKGYVCQWHYPEWKRKGDEVLAPRGELVGANG